MKSKVLLCILLALVVFVSGCTQMQQPLPTADKPFIKTIEVQNSFIHEGSTDKATIGFVVYNPLQITFSGKAELQFEKPNCLSQATSYQKNEFVVESKKSLPLTIDVVSNGYNNANCVGTQLVTVMIKDVSGSILDSKTIEINIVQR